MRQTIYKIMLLGFIAAFMSAGSIDLLAKQPAKPIKVGVRVDIKESSPVQGNITLYWYDGDLKNELGNYFRITQYKKADGKETEKRLGNVERNNKGEYKLVIENLPPADYCYTIDLYDEKNDIASDLTERVCATVGDDNNFRKMYFNCETKLIKLENGQGKFFVDVKNNTNCEFEVKVIETDATVEIAEQGAKGALLKIAAKEKGKYVALLGLVDKCTGELVDRVELVICYGDCANTPEGMYFAEDSQFIQLDDNGSSSTRIKIVNNTNCEFDIMVVESKVKIAVMELGEGFAEIKFTAQEKGKYKSVIGLKNKCTGEIVSKMVFEICWGDCNTNEPGLYFEKGTEFAHKLEEGVAWKYDVNAVSKEDCRLTYYLSDDTGNNTTPDGLRLDEETGMMVWENPVKGEYKVPVIVRSTCDGGATYSQIVGVFYLFVRGEEPEYSSILTCKFYDETDDIKDFFGKVTVWAADDKDPGVPPTPNRKVFTAELRGTSVTITLPAGKYYLKADVKGYKGQYFEDAFELINAKTISIGDNEKVEVSMMLHSIPEPNYFVVTGQVSDAATGEPLPAVVTFLPVKWVLGGKDNDQGFIDFKFDNRVKTDEKGNYSIKLPDTYTYYANAVAMTNTEVYKLQWYEGADSYYEADIIYLDSDKDGINFKLEAAEATQGYMSGSVSDKEGNIVMSTVIALLKDKNNTEYKAVTRTDEEGNFYFSNLKYGEYVVLSLPAENSYIPGYYVTGDYATLKWKEATLVGVGDFAPTMMIDIIHAPSGKDRAKGIARIKGRLLKGLKGLSPDGNNGGNSDDAINGGLVYLTDNTGDVVNYFVTDVDGYFELEGIEPGTYTLSIDKFGFEAYSEVIEVDYTKDIEVETEIVLNQITTSVDYLDFGTVRLSVSPMPVSNISKVTFDGKSGVSNIRLVDITGNVVYQTTLNTIDGNNNFDLDAKNITTGTYILVIENEEKSVAGSINIIK
jgi:carboxypeptidase family protein/type IX secretion system substrate protein